VLAVIAHTGPIQAGLGAEPRPAAAESEPGSVELLGDPEFRHGLRVLAARAGAGDLGSIAFADTAAAPVWQLAQWNTRFPLTNAAVATVGQLCVSNVAKWVCLDQSPANGPVITLGVDTRPEYGDTLRRSAAEPWVHLLVQQEIQGAPSLAELASLRLRFEARLHEARTFRPEGYSPGLHAAQFQIVFTLNNTRRNSPGFGDYLWFVAPVYDDRYAVPPEYVAQDFAVTKGKLIFNPGGAVAGLEPMRPGVWQRVDLELRPWLERALRSAWEKGYLRGSRELADYRLAHLNFGWEVPGLNRVSLELRGLSVRAVRQPDPAVPPVGAGASGR